MIRLNSVRSLAALYHVHIISEMHMLERCWSASRSVHTIGHLHILFIYKLFFEPSYSFDQIFIEYHWFIKSSDQDILTSRSLPFSLTHSLISHQERSSHVFSTSVDRHEWICRSIPISSTRRRCITSKTGNQTSKSYFNQKLWYAWNLFLLCW